jgi:hypothetical protein
MFMGKYTRFENLAVDNFAEYWVKYKTER